MTETRSLRERIQRIKDHDHTRPRTPALRVKPDAPTSDNLFEAVYGDQRPTRTDTVTYHEIPAETVRRAFLGDGS
jgi:hypothetical protein